MPNPCGRILFLYCCIHLHKVDVDQICPSALRTPNKEEGEKKKMKKESVHPEKPPTHGIQLLMPQKGCPTLPITTQPNPYTSPKRTTPKHLITRNNKGTNEYRTGKKGKRSGRTSTPKRAEPASSRSARGSFTNEKGVKENRGEEDTCISGIIPA